MADATSSLVTRNYLDRSFETLEDYLDMRFAEQRAELYRVSLVQGGIIIGAVVALVKLL